MATPLKKIALVGGSGNLGPHLVKAISANPDFELTVISRQSSKAEFPAGTTVVKVGDDYPCEEVVAAFKGQDAVVLSVSFMAEKNHHSALVDASVEAGVKRLIPSTYAGRLDLPEARQLFPIAAMKGGALDYVQSKVSPEWSYTAVCCGLFLNLCTRTNFMGLDPSKRAGKIYGDGNARFSATTEEVIAQGVAAVLAKPEETANRTVYVSSHELTMNELLAAYKQATGRDDWEVSYASIEEGTGESYKALGNPDCSMGDRMKAIGRLGLIVGLKPELGADFVAAGVSDNELLGLARGPDLAEVLKAHMNTKESVSHNMKG
jgi:uncharacterized protein YbjT (DUF2867 family)